MKSYLTLIWILFFPHIIFSQIIEIKNGDFEEVAGTIRDGEFQFDNLMLHWKNSGFPYESPPSIISDYSNQFDIPTKPYSGRHAISMVVRDNETYESITQKLDSPLQTNICYEISMQLAKSPLVNSYSRTSINPDGIPLSSTFDKAVVLEIWGEKEFGSANELLAFSRPINHLDWQKYFFRFCPEMEALTYIKLEAYYDDKSLSEDIIYNGNILLDDISNITPIGHTDEILPLVSNFSTEKTLSNKDRTHKFNANNPEIKKIVDNFKLLKHVYTQANKYGLYRVLNDLDDEELERYVPLYLHYFGDDQYFKNVKEVLTFIDDKRENGLSKNGMAMIKKFSASSFIAEHPMDWEAQFYQKHQDEIPDYLLR